MPPLIHQSVRAFLAVAEHGNLSGAGAAISRSPSAVSLQIAALESRLGQPLFTRGARGMHLSNFGRVLLRHARLLMAAEKVAAAELKSAAMSGEVRFGMPQDFASSKLASTLDRFRRAHPGVRVSAVIDRNTVITTLAQRGELDLAILISRRRPRRALASFEREYHWYGGPGLAWEQPRPLPLVLLDAPCVYREFAVRTLEREGIASEVAFSTASVTAMWAAVAAGVGVTARMDLGAPRAARRVDELLGLPSLPTTVLSVVSPGSSAHAPAKALAALVQDSLGRMARTRTGTGER